ncbi:MAG TPA: hypothetical protein PLP66_10270 [Phycisphaerae bacterium]|nr:hypothetical protein [Phycisphaerae bacterium]HPM24278.1 hypothetical protein [Phycisphaerae bacterium]
MSFGPVTIVTVDTLDVQAPGAPGLTAQQISNHQGEFTLTPPTTDADGSPLSGLTFGQAVVIQADAPTAELFRNDFESALQFNGAQVFELDLADGAPQAREFAIAEPGRLYSILARVADHPRGQ